MLNKLICTIVTRTQVGLGDQPPTNSLGGESGQMLTRGVLLAPKPRLAPSRTFVRPSSDYKEGAAGAVAILC